MSSPVNDEHQDKRFMYAPPWARETAKEPSEAIVAAIERLRVQRERASAASEEPGETPAASHDNANAPASVAQADASDLETAMAEAIRASKWTPRSLDPVGMPEPPKPRLDGPTLGMVLRLGGAVVAAAVIALVLSGAFRLPAIDVALGAREGSGPAFAAVLSADLRRQDRPIVAAETSATPPRVVDAATTGPVTAQPAIQPAIAPASALPSDVLTAYASLDTQLSVTSPKVRDVAAVSVSTSAKAAEARAMDRDELAGLVKRGQALLNEGDIASARLLLRRAAEAGDANAALMMAATYDRGELAKLKVIGVAHDHAQAKVWYTKAVEHGSAEAVRRLQQLAQRSD